MYLSMSITIVMYSVVVPYVSIVGIMCTRNGSDVHVLCYFNQRFFFPLTAHGHTCTCLLPRCAYSKRQLSAVTVGLNGYTLENHVVIGNTVIFKMNDGASFH